MLPPSKLRRHGNSASKSLSTKVSISTPTRFTEFDADCIHLAKFYCLSVQTVKICHFCTH